AQRARWRQYRTVWAFVEGSACRRETILRHFGDTSVPAPAPGVPCCDACEAGWLPVAPGRRSATGAAPGELDDAIVSVVAFAMPAVGRTRTVEILRGSRSKAVISNGYDGLPAYSTFDHLTGPQVLSRVDELIAAGRLRSTGGAYPKLQVVPAERAAA
ncbi:MAG: RecQ family zinc-binding domain-containing protein, partial [Solirubrobacterales bacterium]|nr:RecQ family zinc-binding domain-containing protein [Solirubrobacterales bacterium]